MSRDSEEKTYVAFLRGINVGGNTLIKMDELRRVFESLGFARVRTVLASGNVLFRAPPQGTASISRSISVKLREALGREISVIVRPLDDLAELKARNPFNAIKAAPGTRLFVTFLPEGARHGDIPMPAARDGYRILSASDRMICSVLEERPGVGAVHLMGAIEKEFGPLVTTRTWNTIERVIRAGEAA